MIPFIGYQPDVDPTIPGVFTNCAAIVPTSKGFKGAPAPANISLGALGAQCYGAVMLRKRDDSVRFFASTAATLQEGSGSTWTDRSKGGGYSLGTSNFWRFAQYDDTTLAVAKTEILQWITTATNFANVTSTAPKASIVETTNNFVFLFDVNDQGSLYDGAERTNGWWCGAKGSAVGGTWVPSVVTECATGTLSSTPGGITAGRRFGYQIIAYKLRSMYLGTYVGQPVIWDFQLLPGEAGAMSQEAVVQVGTPENPMHIFMGFDNFYAFSGGRAVPIGNPIKDTVFAELNQQYYYACRAVHDAVNGLVYFYYPVASSNMPDKCVVYNYRRNQWGRDDRQIQAAFEYLGAAKTYADLGTDFSTYADFPNLPYGIAFIGQSMARPAIFNTSHRPQSLTGATGNSSITLGDYGDDKQFVSLTQVRPRFLTAPTSANFVNFYRDVLSDSLTQDMTTPINGGRFDMLRSARWHRGRFDLVGNHEISGMDADLVADGEA